MLVSISKNFCIEERGWLGSTCGGARMSPLREFFLACALAFGLSVASVLLMLAHRDIRPPDCQSATRESLSEVREDCATAEPPQRRLGDKIWKLLIG
jgi:hypothetical protein